MIQDLGTVGFLIHKGNPAAFSRAFLNREASAAPAHADELPNHRAGWAWGLEGGGGERVVLESSSGFSIASGEAGLLTRKHLSISSKLCKCI